MGVYVLTDGSGTYIRKDEATGRYVPIRSFKHAKQWDSILKAKSVLDNSISKSIRNSYAVQLVDTEEIIEKEDLSKQNELIFREIEDDKISDWLSKINTIKDVLSGSDSRVCELTEKLSEVDKEIVDVQHYIEFGKFNCYQGWMCFKMLQNMLKQRRKYKNEISVLNMIKQCKFDMTSISALSQTISDAKNKCYTPRAFPELFRSGK